MPSTSMGIPAVSAGASQYTVGATRALRRGRVGLQRPATGAIPVLCLPKLRECQDPVMLIDCRNPLSGKENSFMTSVRLRDNEPFEVALRRFKRTIEKTGLLTELRAREFYEKPTAERKRKMAAAVKRHYKRLRSQQLPPKLF